MCGIEEKFECGGGMLDSDDVRTAIISGETFKNKAVQYAVVDGLAIYEGCIVLGPADSVEQKTRAAQDALSADPSAADVAHGVGISGQSKRWPNGLMPYEIDPGLPNQQRVTDAINHWTSNTSMRFVQRTSANASTYPDYVRFRSATGCWSYVGRQGGMQEIGLANGCGLGATIHEIGHAFGLWHEQSREDRDSKIQINWQNILPGREHNFNQHITDGDDYGAYDYGSIMHYPTWAFSKNGQPTIQTIPAGIPIGQRNGLSAGDISAIHAMYQVWHYNITLSRTYATASSKNCWVLPAGQSWKRIDPNASDGCANVFDLCCDALAFGRKVHLFMDGSNVLRAQLV